MNLGQVKLNFCDYRRFFWLKMNTTDTILSMNLGILLKGKSIII